MLCLLIQNDFKVPESYCEMVLKLKIETILGLMKRFKMPGDEDFPMTVPAIACFLDPKQNNTTKEKEVCVFIYGVTNVVNTMCNG